MGNFEYGWFHGTWWLGGLPETSALKLKIWDSLFINCHALGKPWRMLPSHNTTPPSSSCTIFFFRWSRASKCKLSLAYRISSRESHRALKRGCFLPLPPAGCKTLSHTSRWSLGLFRVGTWPNRKPSKLNRTMYGIQTFSLLHITRFTTRGRWPRVSNLQSFAPHPASCTYKVPSPKFRHRIRASAQAATYGEGSESALLPSHLCPSWAS